MSFFLVTSDPALMTDCFSWLHLFGKSKRRYKVSRRKKQSTRSPARTQQFRQTRYRHIAESRNSAVIPTRIAKRSSTASNFNVSSEQPTKSFIFYTTAMRCTALVRDSYKDTVLGAGTDNIHYGWDHYIADDSSF